MTQVLHTTCSGPAQVLLRSYTNYKYNVHYFRHHPFCVSQEVEVVPFLRLDRRMNLQHVDLSFSEIEFDRGHFEYCSFY